MAKTLLPLENGLRVKYLVKPKKYYLFFGSGQATIDGKYQEGFDTKEEAEAIGNMLRGVGRYRTTF